GKFMRFPEALQPLQFSRMSMEFSKENRAIPVNMIESLRLHQGNPLHYASLPNKPTMPNQPSGIHIAAAAIKCKPFRGFYYTNNVL
ncbi:hypothetical protein HN51_071573, partial [Arachis hypogaea]